MWVGTRCGWAKDPRTSRAVPLFQVPSSVDSYRHRLEDFTRICVCLEVEINTCVGVHVCCVCVCARARMCVKSVQQHCIHCLKG